MVRDAEEAFAMGAGQLDRMVRTTRRFYFPASPIPRCVPTGRARGPCRLSGICSATGASKFSRFRHRVYASGSADGSIAPNLARCPSPPMGPSKRSRDPSLQRQITEAQPHTTPRRARMADAYPASWCSQQRPHRRDVRQSVPPDLVDPF